MRSHYFDQDLVRTAANIIVNARAVSGLDCRKVYEYVRDVYSASDLAYHHRVTWHFLEATKDQIEQDVYGSKLPATMEPASYRILLAQRLVGAQSVPYPEPPETLSRAFCGTHITQHVVDLFRWALVRTANTLATELSSKFKNAGLVILPLDVINRSNANSWGRSGNIGIARLINEPLDNGMPIQRPPEEEIYTGYYINLDQK